MRLFKSKLRKRIESNIGAINESIAKLEKEQAEKRITSTLKPAEYCHYWAIIGELKHDKELLNNLL